MMRSVVDALDRGVVAFNVWSEWASATPDFGDKARLRAAHSWTMATVGVASFLGGLLVLDHTVGETVVSPAKAFIAAGLISTVPAVTSANLVWLVAMRRRPVSPMPLVPNA